MGMQNGAVTLKDSVAVPYKTKHTLTIQSSQHAPWYLPKGLEHVGPPKNPHTGIYNTFIHNCQNLEGTKRSFRCVDKFTVAHPDNGMLFSAKKKKRAIQP